MKPALKTNMYIRLSAYKTTFYKSVLLNLHTKITCEYKDHILLVGGVVFIYKFHSVTMIHTPIKIKSFDKP